MCNCRSLDADATRNLPAYAAGGSELGMGGARLRLEARDYLAGFESLDSVGASYTQRGRRASDGLRFVGR